MLPSAAAASPQPPPSLHGSPQARRERTLQLRAKLRVLHEKDDPRLCSDVPCLSLLAGFGLPLTALAGLAAALGDRSWLQRGWDYHARLCGAGAQHGRPFVYWPHPGELSMGRCVDRCPSFEDFANDRFISVPQAEPLLVREEGAGEDSVVSFSQSARLISVPVYPTTPAVGRFCLPAERTVLSLLPASARRRQDGVAPDDRSGAGGDAPEARDSMLPLVQASEALGAWAPQVRRTIGDLQQVWGWFLVSVTVVPLLAGAVPAALAGRGCGAWPTLWCLLLGSGVGAIGLGCRLLVHFWVRSSDVALIYLNGLELRLAWLAGWGLVAGGAAALGLSLALRDALQWAATTFEASALLLREEGLAPPLGLLSLAVAAAQAAASLAWVAFVEAAASAAALDWPAELPSAEGGAGTGGEEPTAWGTWPEERAEVVPGGPIVRGIQRAPRFRWPVLPLLLAAALLLRLVLAWLAALGQYLAAYVVARWYFSGPSRGSKEAHLGGRPLGAACGAVLGAHLGGVTSNALLHALLPSEALRWAGTVLHKQLAPWHAAQGGGLSACCTRRVGLCFGRLATALGAAPCADVALLAGHFHHAAGRSAGAVNQALPSVQFLSGLPALLDAAAAGLAALAAGAAVLLVGLPGQQHWQVDYVETEVGVAGLAAFLACAPAGAWAGGVSAGFDALLRCFICDDHHHRQVEDKLPGQESGRWAASVEASYALWSSEYTPARLRSLVFQAAQTVQADMARRAGRSSHGLDDVGGYGYAAVGAAVPDAADSDSGPDR